MTRRERTLVLVAAATFLYGCTGTVGGSSTPGPGDSGNGNRPPPGGSGGSGSGGNQPSNPIPGTPGAPPPAPGAAAETPGRTPLRRLTRTQYNNTIRDLLGVTGDFGASFSGDEDAGGFKSNLTSPVSEQQVEQYNRVAEELGTKAVAGGLNKISPCTPPQTAEAACADQFVKAFGKRAFRRPLLPEEVERYKAVYEAGRTGADFGAGVALVIAAMLQSPNFLYLPELGQGPGGAEVALGPYELASRLSYFLLGSMPDDELFAAADGDRLKTPDQVAEQTRRLLGSSRARDGIVTFFQQWLEISDLGTIDKDSMIFPEFTPALKTAMGDEIAAFVRHVTLDAAADGRLGTLLTASYTFPGGPVRALYGLQGQGAGEKTDLPAGQRAGLLTLPGVMSVYSHPNQTGPVGRGYMVSDRLLCTTPPPAPDNVDAMLPKPDPNVTMRERLETHRKDPSCASCHQLMDPYGLTFEIFDAIGRYRTKDGNKDVDASSKGLPAIGDVTNAIDLMDKLSKSQDVRKCVTRQWFRYAFGRMEGPSDDPTIAAGLAAFGRSDFVMTDLMVGLATSKGFRFRAPLVP
jgi:hypothetical protein